MNKVSHVNTNEIAVFSHFNMGRRPLAANHHVSQFLNIPPENFFNSEDATTENEKEQLIRLLSQCDERDIKVFTATAKELIESK